MKKLTDGDKKRIVEIQGDVYFEDAHDDLLYVAGYKAGLERAAEEIERRFGMCPQSNVIRDIIEKEK